MRKLLPAALFISVLVTFVDIVIAQPITVIGHSSKFNSSSSVTVNLPDSVQQGDFLLAHITLRIGSGFTMKTDPGWALLREISAGGTSGVGMHIFYKIATALEPSSYTFSDSTGSSSSDKLGIITAFRGVDSISPIDSENGTGLSSSPYSTPDDTTLTDSCMIVTLFGIRSTGTSSWTPPVGMTEEYDTSGIQSTRITGCGDYVIQSTAGPTGQKTAIPSGGSGNVTAEIIALRPASITTRVHSAKNNFTFEIFPNPVVNKLWIAGNELSVGGTMNIAINNILGKTLQYTELKTQNHQFKTSFDVSSLAKGIYFVSIESEKGISVVRFVKD